MTPAKLFLARRDTEWAYTGIDHDRRIVRAIVFDDAGFYYFVRLNRDDEFGKATLIETSGGGIESGEDPEAAIRRELREELGAEVDTVAEIGVVSDYYNLIRRHNINRYYLNPLQYSCLENPMDRGAWQSTVHRVAKSQTRLKRLSTD